jgi:hypothetical protein
MTIPAISLTTEKRLRKQARKAERLQAVILLTIRNEHLKQARKGARPRVGDNQAKLTNLGVVAKVAVVAEISPMIGKRPQKPDGKGANKVAVETVNLDAV